jgi:GTPase SAR1 family protein
MDNEVFQSSIYNILLFGKAGSGKSSFVNSIYNIYTESDGILSLAETSGGSDHTTKKYTSYDFEKYGFRFFDTWGLTKETYKSFELEKILQGEMPQGFSYEMNYSKKLSSKGQEYIRKLKETAENRIDCVIFFVPIGDILDNDYEYIKSFKKKFLDIPFILLLCFTETLTEEVRWNPLQFRHSMIEEKKTMLRKYLGIDLNSIHLLINYTEENERSFDIDQNNFFIISQAIKKASFYRESYEKLMGDLSL